ncbi:MAG TPA: hypothetical protein PKE26_01995 [Kiritimatiellia bacterium]|nr:hypothetical protein [Kiritimatiellia bacterium]HMO51435.1 hypothetical protein [Kiritimatiellia bacterium]HMO97860.1 hypothetical protein [Kiritimatiellia bacterium]HMP97292.1 hypothetical protein [Kiritimatiellia bacterium]
MISRPSVGGGERGVQERRTQRSGLHPRNPDVVGRPSVGGGTRTVYRNRAPNIFATLCLIALTALLVGCEPMLPEDRAFFEQRERDRINREHLMRTASEGVRAQDLIDRVRQHPAPEGEGTVEDWLERQSQALRGQVMFPRWTTSRRGSNKQEISFHFVLIDAQNHMRRLAYSWDIDVLDMTISEPRFAQLEESVSPDRALAQQQERRVREHESFLR